MPKVQTSKMLSRPAGMLTMLLIATTQTAIIPAPHIPPPPIPIMGSTDNIHSQTPQPNDTSPSSLKFLGVDCYYLSPEKEPVSLLSCQPLFASLVQKGHIYKPGRFYNGFNFKHGQDPCTIKIFSPAKEDRLSKIYLSVSQIISYTTEVLHTCQGTGTGGANVFEGSWRISVSRDYIKTQWDFASAKRRLIAKSSLPHLPIPTFVPNHVPSVNLLKTPMPSPPLLAPQRHKPHLLTTLFAKMRL